MAQISLAAAPLPLIFATGNFSSKSKNGNSLTWMVPIRSADVFIHVSRLPSPEVINGKLVHAAIGSTSVCTNLWKFPRLRKSDALGVSTRILIFLRLPTKRAEYYMLFQYEFSSMINGNNNICLSEDNGNSIFRNYAFKLQQKSPIYCYDKQVDTIFLSSAMRTGRCVGSTSPAYGSIIPMTGYAIDMHAILNRPEHKSHQNDADTESASVMLDQLPNFQEISVSYLPGCDNATLMNLNVEEYSGAVWYIRGSSVFINHFV